MDHCLDSDDRDYEYRLCVCRENLMWKCDAVQRSAGKIHVQSNSQMVSAQSIDDYAEVVI